MYAPLKNKESAKETIQRKVYVLNQKYEYDDNNKKAITTNGGLVYELDAKDKSGWFTDPWKRNYVNLAELQDHVDGTPVSCGLSKPLARWYRLPFGEKLFALGEQHGTYKHGALLKESNRKGNILSENVGAKHINSERPTFVESDEREFKGYAIESTYAKTHFGIKAIKLKAEQRIKLKGEQGLKNKNASSIFKEEEEADLWAENYAKAKSRGRDEEGNPYYENLMGEGKKIIVRQTKLKKYDVEETAKGVSKKYNMAIKSFPSNKEAQEVGNLLTRLSDLNSDEEIVNTTKEILEMLNALMKKEAEVLTRDNSKMLNERMEEANKVKVFKGKNREFWVEAMAYRDLAMLISIKSSLQDGNNYEMIGVGDLHLQTLGPALKEMGIEVIRLDEFVNGDDWGEDAVDT